MSLCQVDLLRMCRAKLAEEASRRDPQLCIVVRHFNLLETLTTNLIDTCHGNITKRVQVPPTCEELRKRTEPAGEANEDARSDNAECLVEEVDLLEYGNVRKEVAG